MTFLFLIFLIVIILALFGMRLTSLILALINLLIALGMLWYHATTTLEVLL